MKMRAINRLIAIIISGIGIYFFLPSFQRTEPRIYLPTVILDSLDNDSSLVNPTKFHENDSGGEFHVDVGGEENDEDTIYSQINLSEPIKVSEVDQDKVSEPSQLKFNTLLITPACSPSTLVSEFKDFTNSKLHFWQSLSSSQITGYHDEWKDYISKVNTTLDYTPNTRGIIISSAPHILQKTLKLIYLLRSLNCTLPIQIWHNSELGDPDILRLRNSSELVSVHVLEQKSYDLDGGKLFQIKIDSILQSDLDTILFLDTDNIPLRDPTFLMDSKEFGNGAMFWQDYWKTFPDNPVWKVMGIECVDEYEQESGQILIRKSTPGISKTLLLTSYFQAHASIYFKLVLGDKDTFRFAFRALNQPFYMVPDRVRPIGAESGEFKGHSMGQSFRGEVLFVHWNLLKYFKKEDFEGKKVFGRIQTGGVPIFKDMSIRMVDGENDKVTTEEFKSDLDLEAFYQMEL